MNSTFKGILIGVSASVLILVFAEILLNYENQPNVATSTISNNEINVKSTLQDIENTKKQVNTNLQGLCTKIHFLQKPARSKSAETPMFTPLLRAGFRIFCVLSNFCAKLSTS